ncbi:ImmA/IrrE family metallo-endopeptidase [Microbacterium sp. LWO14-1.2]|uniref:ImmA/IrrE family metallo-endopeptidase n=1 Tax=Microbacterium sp. LWO14-1.2 TaxID=3135263 RepID=UPI003139866B
MKYSDPRYIGFGQRWRRLKVDERFSELVSITQDLGLRIHVADLPPGKLGLHCHQTREIWIDVDLSPSEMTSVLAHEVGHAVFGHEDSTPENEVQANEWAAVFLVPDDEWTAYLDAYGGCKTAFFADCFGVMEDVIKTRWDQHKRTMNKAPLCAV